MNKSAIAYIRVSRMGTAATKFKDKESPETQMSHISKYCEQKGYQIASKYEDLDYSGGTDERPGFQKMFWEIRNNPKIDVVVVYSLSRFARDVLDLNKYLVELEKHNVDFVSVTEEFLRTDTMYGKFLINIIGAVAQLQREQIAENVRDNMRNRALRGQFLGGVPPFGFTLNKETQKFELVIEEAAVVKDIFDMYLNGDGILKIRNYLNENNVLGRNDYSVGTLQSILKNIHYTGDFVYSKRRNVSRTKKKKTSKDEWITVENNHPQIVTKQDFLMVQDLLKKKNRAKPENLDKRVSGNQFLSGLITCNVCEHSYYHGPRRNGRGVKFDYYVCGGYKTKGKPYCNNKRGLRIDRIDEILFMSVIEILKLDRVMEIYNETANKIQNRLKDDLSNQNVKKERIKTLEIEKNRYLELIIQSENQVLIQEYEEEIQKRITEIKDLKEVMKSKGSTDETLNYFKKLKEEIQHTFEDQYNFSKIIDLGIESVGGIFKHFIDNIRVQDDEPCKRTKLDIQYKVGIPELKLLQDIKPVIKILENDTLIPNANHNSISDMLNQAAKNYQVCVYEMEYAPLVSLEKRVQFKNDETLTNVVKTIFVGVFLVF